MKELNRKVFIIIFSILSLFLLFFIITYNVDVYKKEYDGVRRNLSFVNDNGFVPNSNNNPMFKPNDEGLDNMMIMDYEVYTILIEDSSISKIILHSNTESDFDIECIASNILNNDKGVHIGNLYNNHYSYNYMDNSMIIINTENINHILLFTLIKSILIFFTIEVLIYLVSRFITHRVTKPAEEAFAKQKDFIADASHELKTPLAVIMASADELKSDKKNAKYVDNIKYETDRMNSLIKGLLDLSKLENGVLKDSYQDEDLSRIIERTCLTFEGIAYESNITIDSKIDKELVFKCSKAEMEKLISILLDNAVKHSYKNTEIQVKAFKDKNLIHIEVMNHGDPIREGDEEKIFERFYRADKSRKRESNRYGLGLAIAKNIVMNHNGSIKASSKDGLTTFKIILKK